MYFFSSIDNYSSEDFGNLIIVQVCGSCEAFRFSILFPSLCLGESLSEDVCIWELRLDNPSEDEDEKGEFSIAEVF